MLSVLAVSLKIAKKAKDQSDFDIQVLDIHFDIFCLQGTLLQGCFCLRVHLTGACVSGADKHYAIIIYNMNKCYRNEYKINDIQTT